MELILTTSYAVLIIVWLECNNYHLNYFSYWWVACEFHTRNQLSLMVILYFVLLIRFKK